MQARPTVISTLSESTGLLHTQLVTGWLLSLSATLTVCFLMYVHCSFVIVRE